MINHLIRSALLTKAKNPRFAYIAPTFKQAKAIAWDYVKQFTAKIPYTKFNETELRVDLPNGSRITLLGSENSDGLRGIYLDGCVIDEYANVSEKLFPEIIRPALSDRKGYCVFIGTPAGMNNNFYDLYQHAQGAEDWFNYKAKASETKIVDDTPGNRELIDGENFTLLEENKIIKQDEKVIDSSQDNTTTQFLKSEAIKEEKIRPGGDAGQGEFQSLSEVTAILPKPMSGKELKNDML